eukprot:6130687-Prymnesium_polylepis.1
MGGGASKATVYPDTVTVKSEPATQGRSQLGPNFISAMDSYGSLVFQGAVAKKYLQQAGLPAGLEEKVFDDKSLLMTHKDTIAKAVVKWAQDNGASMYAHWFQPLGSEMMRQGCTGQVGGARASREREEGAAPVSGGFVSAASRGPATRAGQRRSTQRCTPIHASSAAVAVRRSRL